MKFKQIVFPFCLFLLQNAFCQTVTQTLTISSTFTVPCGVTSLTVCCWGGGGGAGGSTGVNGGSSGGGGGYCTNIIVTAPGSLFTYTIGFAGNGGNGSNGFPGGKTTFSTIIANGGGGGSANAGSIGIGGTGSGGTVTNGISGTIGNTTNGGNGGMGGNGGGIGGAGGTIGINGTAGVRPGGGGGGGGPSTGTNTMGGAGGSGQVQITFIPCPGWNPCSAIPITAFPFIYTGTTINNANSLNGGCLGNNVPVNGFSKDFFFSVTVAAETYLNLQLTGTNATDMNELSVYSAALCTGPFTCLNTGNGVWAGGLQTTGSMGNNTPAADSPCKKVRFVTAGTYYLRVDAVGTPTNSAVGSGPFTLKVDTSTTPGDFCSNAIYLNPGTPYCISNTDCLFSRGVEDPIGTMFCSGPISIENTNWFTFTSDGSGAPVNVTINSVNCTSGYWQGPSYFAAQGQMTILTGTCGVGFSRALTGADTCQILPTGASYSATLPNTSTITYYIIWDGNGGAECSYCVTVNNIIILPVELFDFKVKANNGKADISWKTASESNNDYFTIEKSSDAINFKEFKKIKGAGNSTASKTYTYTDDNPYTDVSYYRLKQTNFNGTFKYSQTQILNFNSEFPEGLQIIPNPASKEITLQFNCAAQESATIIIYESNGIPVASLEQNCVIGKNSVQLDLENYSKGIYFITLSTNAKNYQTKFIKN